MTTMLKQLKIIKKDPKQIKHLHYGICHTLRQCEDYSWGRICKSFESWPEYTGDDLYPVPHPTQSPKLAYTESGEKAMWSKTDPYGAARWRLVDHMIKEFSR